jgi:hypothetical protein
MTRIPIHSHDFRIVEGVAYADDDEGVLRACIGCLDERIDRRCAAFARSRGRRCLRRPDDGFDTCRTHARREKR